MSCERNLVPVLIILGMTFAPAQQAQQSKSEPGLAGEQANTTAPPQSARVRLSAGEAAGLLHKRVAPEYPPKARSNRIQGIVLLNATISKEGTVTDLSVISGDPLLAEAAINAIKKWKYKPYLVQGEPVEVETTIQMSFTLSG